jgi:hypothetical protein
MNTPFWRGVFSDGDQPSFSRVATGFVVAFSLGWVSRIVWKTTTLPDFGGLVLFIGTLYGVNRVTAAFGTKSTTPPGTSPP